MLMLRCANDLFAYCGDKARKESMCAINPSDCMHYRKASEVIAPTVPEKEKKGGKRGTRKVSEAQG